MPKIVAASRLDTSGVHGFYDKAPIDRARDGRAWMIGDAVHPMCPFQGQGANTAIIDAVELAAFFSGDANDDAKAASLEANIVKRGRQHVLASRGNAKRFHETSAWGQTQRNFVVRFANFFINGFRRRG